MKIWRSIPFAALAAMTLSLLPSAGFGGGLFAPFSIDSAGVLPKGVRNVRYGGFTTQIDDKFNNSGTIVPLANSFNKAVTWKDLIESQPAGFNRGTFTGGLDTMGIKMDEVAGQAQGLVNARVTTTAPILAYGVTETLTTAVAVPIIYTNVNVSTGWTASPEFQARLDELCRQGLCNKVQTYGAQLQNVVHTKLSRLGYKALEDQQATEVGDVALVAKYQVFKNDDVAFALSPKVVLPTGRTADVDKIVDIAPGDGQFDVGLSAVSEFNLASYLTLVTAANYTYQAPSMKAKRVPIKYEESASADVDYAVKEKLGDTMGASVGFKIKPLQLWTIGTAYSYSYKRQDNFQGSKYDEQRYGWLAKDTDQTMRAAIVGLTFSTVPLFRSGKFPLPLEASVNYASVLSGTNVSKIDLTSFDLSAFF